VTKPPIFSGRQGERNKHRGEEIVAQGGLPQQRDFMKIKIGEQGGGNETYCCKWPKASLSSQGGHRGGIKTKKKELSRVKLT